MAWVPFAYLQVMDFLLTLAGLMVGGSEFNWMFRNILAQSTHPVLDFAIMKALFVIPVVFLATRFPNKRLLYLVNVGFMLLAFWNVVAILLSSSRCFIL